VSRIAYVHGRYLPHSEAAVHVEDRGFQFADGVYEVWAVFGGRLADADGHLTRLERSLDELRIVRPLDRSALLAIVRETLRRNRVRDGLCYIQITRGQARRDHVFPAPIRGRLSSSPPRPWISPPPRPSGARGRRGHGAREPLGAVRHQTVSLLPNVLAKQSAKEAGAVEAWFVGPRRLRYRGRLHQRLDRRCRRPPAHSRHRSNILRGITRGSLIELARERQMAVDERPFTVAEAKQAREAFITGSLRFRHAIVAFDDAMIGDGRRALSDEVAQPISRLRAKLGHLTGRRALCVGRFRPVPPLRPREKA
jgi:D-alanine transaminase